jgi:hypothetical protein
MLKRFCIIAVLLTTTGIVARAGLLVEPARQEITLKPGGSFTGSYRVTNDLGKTTGIGVETRYWYVSKEEEENVKVADWLTVTPSSFTFKPGESVDVRYTVKMSTFVTGTRVVMVTFVPEGQEGVTLVVSVSLYVTIQGTQKIEWDFGNFTLTSYQGTAQFSTIVKNTGNVHVRPSGYVKVIKKKKEQVLNILEGRPVYPGQTRQVIAQGKLKEIFPKRGKYKVKISLTSGDMTKEKTYDVQIKKTGEVIIK